MREKEKVRLRKLLKVACDRHSGGVDARVGRRAVSCARYSRGSVETMIRPCWDYQWIYLGLLGGVWIGKGVLS